MSAKNLRLAQSVDKNIVKLPKYIQTKIFLSFDKIMQNPVSGIKLHGELKNYYKFRVGDFRIIYSFDAKESLIQVVKIEHRQGVYR
jgi:mRNA interferase RelE/StbE